jgi:hypothetical protein
MTAAARRYRVKGPVNNLDAIQSVSQLPEIKRMANISFSLDAENLVYGLSLDWQAAHAKGSE